MEITHYSVVPAYGADYFTEEDVKSAWVSGKDFQIRSIDRWNGSYISIHEAQEMGLSVQIRYNNLQKIYIWPEPEVGEL